MSALTVIPLDELAEMQLRTTPVQERSRTTLTKLKEAAQEVLADPTIGRDHFRRLVQKGKRISHPTIQALPAYYPLGP